MAERIAVEPRTFTEHELDLGAGSVGGECDGRLGEVEGRLGEGFSGREHAELGFRVVDDLVGGARGADGDDQVDAGVVTPLALERRRVVLAWTGGLSDRGVLGKATFVQDVVLVHEIVFGVATLILVAARGLVVLAIEAGVGRGASQGSVPYCSVVSALLTSPSDPKRTTATRPPTPSIEMGSGFG